MSWMSQVPGGLRVRVAVFAIVLAPLVAMAPSAEAQPRERPGILLLAHGGAREWNERIHALAAELDALRPTALALGMASRPSIQAAVDTLTERGVTSIVAVPLFISSHSSVITSTEYLLGARDTAPPELATFAKMDHGAHGPDHSGDATARVVVRVPVTMTGALDRHPLVAEILATRASAISASPQEESVVIVAHGPTADRENQQWLGDMAVLAAALQAKIPFHSVDYLTVRDDAPAPIRDAATAQLRALVQRRTGEGRRVLVVPLLIAFGGIEAGVRKRLEGLDYVMAGQGLAPDPRLKDWILEMAGR